MTDMISQPVKRIDEEATSTAKLVADNYNDEQVKTTFLDLIIQMYFLTLQTIAFY